MEDLKKIDAIDVINMLEEVNKLFPNGKPPKEIDKRNEVIDSWCDGQYEDLLESLDERFYNELQENLELNIDEIVRRLL